MRKLIYTLAGAAALASASMAGAASVVTGSGQTLTPPDSGLFGAKITGGPTSFNDTFTFTIAGSAGSLNSQVSTLLLNGSQNINFTSILLDSTYAFTKTSTDPAARRPVPIAGGGGKNELGGLAEPGRLVWW